MKKLFVIFTFLLSLTSCKDPIKENITIYVDRNLDIVTKKIINLYENKNDNIKINLLSTIPKNLENIDIIITDNENIFYSEENLQEDSGDKKSPKDYKNLFEKSYFTKDSIVIIGHRKLNNLEDLLHTYIAVPNYNNSVGIIFTNFIENKDFLKNISKNFEYKEDSISAMQSVDLYEVDYAVINTLLLKSTKNSEICYKFPDDFNNKLKYKNIIIYNKYINKNSSKKAKDFYIFLNDKKVEKLINRNKKID